MATYHDCLSVSAQCPVTATAHGYAPSLPANATLLAVFSVVLLAQLLQGIGWRTWGFMTAVVLGTLIEIIGYSGRLVLHSNPWSQTGLLMDSLCLTSGPVFYSAALYLCYLHLVTSFRPTNSRIHPKVYPLIASSTAILPLILQASGSILRANEIHHGSNPALGTHMIIAGLAFQILTMLLFALLCFEFGIRAHLERRFFDPSTEGVRSLKRFRYFWVALAYAYVLILIRSLYRVAELSGGVDSRLARNEITFVVLEGITVLVAAYVISILHPGYVFKSGLVQHEKMVSDDEKSTL